MILYGKIRCEDEVVQVEAEGDDYDAAKAALEARAPEGWELLAVSRWPL